MARIELNQLCKEFRAASGEIVHAISDLSLVIETGELLVLAGPSGSGKTTLLRLIAGLETPTSGSIVIDGRSMAGVPPQDRDVAMVFQSHALFPHLTARDNMAFGLEIRRVSRQEIGRRIGETAELLGIAGLLHRRPAELSGGERQRVAVGRALVRQPRILLLDEPLASVDEPLRIQLRAAIATLHTRARASLLYVTHHPIEAAELGRRIAVLDRGRLRQVGPPETLQASPANDFVSSFLGRQRQVSPP